ncbi:acetyltransferase [Bacillus sp. FJAT-22090]|uniref:GNAT family N-acetyltransferase n=1 Tax=Bacillus sp. FJAT-22090 TaxID=1581038 RepID=UPI0006AE521F|nr:GNAT family N-acetyltransferase [Bacillus sp. FJAT-22090]ALC85021.1 acetyltransferase [Bacillus sp. FJAT-22090]
MQYANWEEFKIIIATNDKCMTIIDMLKQVALWLKKKEINQWRFLLDSGEDKEIEQDINNRNTYIVLKDDEIVATFTLLSKQSEWDRHIWGDDLTSTSLYLHRLAIQPNYMNKGIGSSILEWIQKNIRRDIECIKLDCVADNVKLNKFYKSNGFELVGIEDGHSKFQKSVIID